MKENKIEKPRKYGLIAIFALVLLALLALLTMIGYDKLHELWLVQCEIRDMERQVKITSGKMVKADVIAENFGLRVGANLATIDFAEKREKTLRHIPNLKSVTVTRHLPDRVTITTEERTPLVRLGLRGKKVVTGRVADLDGVVFLCQRGTQTLPTIFENANRPTKVGARLDGRARAALALLAACREPEFVELGVTGVELDSPDYLLALLPRDVRAKIAWTDMETTTAASHASLVRQLTLLTQAIRSRIAEGTRVWNVTDTSVPGRVYADNKGALP